MGHPCLEGQNQGFLINGVWQPGNLPMLQNVCVWRPYYDVFVFGVAMRFFPGGNGRTWPWIKMKSFGEVLACLFCDFKLSLANMWLTKATGIENLAFA